jgi:hypothetical protein
MKVYLKQAAFILAVIAIAKLAESSLNISQTSGIGLYLP